MSALKAGIITVVLGFSIGCACLFGYVNNVYKLATECDFVAPYKCEVIRVIGIPVGPIGIIAGYVSFDGEGGE